jgi:hypothetical protein
MFFCSRLGLESDQETVGREAIELCLNEGIFLFEFFEESVVVLYIEGRVKTIFPSFFAPSMSLAVALSCANIKSPGKTTFKKRAKHNKKRLSMVDGTPSVLVRARWRMKKLQQLFHVADFVDPT